MRTAKKRMFQRIIVRTQFTVHDQFAFGHALVKGYFLQVNFPLCLTSVFYTAAMKIKS